jgi:hypothetical protein
MTLLPEAQQERAELRLVLSSSAFAKSPNLARLLQFLCLKYFEGKSAELKEYNIGVEAFGRSPDFDPTTNSIVRVELHRLREKLNKYFETEGSNDPLVIRLQPGSYTPQFLPHTNHEAISPDLGNNRLPAAATDNRPAVSEAGQSSAQPEEAIPDEGPESKESFGPAVVRRPRWAVMAMLLVLVLVLGLALALFMEVRARHGLKAASVVGSPSHEVTTAFAGGEGEVRILAGYTREGYIDRTGAVWGPDRYYAGGVVLNGRPQFIDRTLDALMFQNCRSGDFSYDIPLKPGVYELHLYFAETIYGPHTLAGGGESSRIFNVELNGRQVLSEFDPLADAGGNNTADERVFTDVGPAPDGKLHLRFFRYQGAGSPQDQPILNAIEIVPGLPGKMHPVRIVAQSNSYTDQSGRVWSPDVYASQGRLTLHNGPVEQTADPGLYYGERFGHFSYAIPVANGRYALTLHFAETYFGPQNPGSGGAGSRLFDVYCNGLRLLHNFDIFKEAGGANRALVKTFHNLDPSPQGKLLLTFLPVENYACVNALEVNPE